MALIVTPGAANANSYCSAQEASTLLMPALRPEVLEDETILIGLEEALAWATRLIEEQIRWRWAPATETQALGWPQAEAVTPYAQALTHTAYTASTVSAASADNSYNDSALGFPAASAGDGLFVEGFLTNTANNGVTAVVSRTTSKIVVSGATLVTEAAGASITVQRLTIPTFLKRATAEYALTLIQGLDTISTAEDLKPFKSLAFGDMRIELRDAALTVQDRMPLPIRRMLAPYAWSAGMGMQMPVYRGGR